MQYIWNIKEGRVGFLKVSGVKWSIKSLPITLRRFFNVLAFEISTGKIKTIYLGKRSSLFYK